MATAVDIARGLVLELTSLAVLKQDVFDFLRRQEELIANLQDAEMEVPDQIRELHCALHHLVQDIDHLMVEKTREMELLVTQQEASGGA